MPDIFLSYTREDAAVAKLFADAFAREGLEVWWDQTLRSGETYDEVTEAALRGARAVVVLWSPRSVASHWVRAEATIAHRAKTLIPATTEACDKPVMFELTQTADLSHWRGEAGDPAWQAFLADVRRSLAAKGEPPPQSPAGRPLAQPRDARPSIAVLPFLDRSGRTENQALCEDMVEDITVALSLNPWVGVVAASATAAYRNGARDLRQIGRELGVRYLLEGNMRRLGDSVRVTGQLVEAESGNIIWTQRFDRPLTEFGALQEDLVTEVAAHLSVQVERAEVEYALKRPSSSTAWEAFVRSVAHLSRSTRTAWTAGVAEGRRALELDPGYGLAYAPLLTSLACLWRLRGDDDPNVAQEIVDSIRKARALEPDHPIVLVGCGGALNYLDKPLEALPLLRRAATTYPHLDYTRTPYGMLLVRLGRLEEALAEFDASERFGPNSMWNAPASIWRSVVHVRADRLEQAQDAIEQALLIVPDSVEALLQSALCLANLDELARARDALRHLRNSDPEVSCAAAEKFVRYMYSGSDAVEAHASTMRRLWDETSSEAKSL
jgi:TolB-like protein/tetratricopeptide (TPR) repeat protein